MNYNDLNKESLRVFKRYIDYPSEEDGTWIYNYVNDIFNIVKFAMRAFNVDDDLLQDIVIKFYEKLPFLNLEQPMIYNWLYTTCKNKIIRSKTGKTGNFKVFVSHNYLPLQDFDLGEYDDTTATEDVIAETIESFYKFDVKPEYFLEFRKPFGVELYKEVFYRRIKEGLSYDELLEIDDKLSVKSDIAKIMKQTFYVYLKFLKVNYPAIDLDFDILSSRFS